MTNMEDRRKVAVFDIDGTIFRSSLLLELVEALIRARVFSKYAQAHYLDTWEKWRDREGSYGEFIESVIRAYLHYIKGIRRADVWKVVEPFAKTWGFEKTYAMVYEVDKRVRFTGKTMYEDIIFDK